MQFTADQYFAAAFTLLMSIAFIAIFYLVGRRDGQEKSKYYASKISLMHAREIDMIKHLSRIRTENDSLRQQALDLAESVAELESRPAITDQQRDQVIGAVRQLSMCAEVMDAMGNYENAKKQRSLGCSLMEIVRQSDQQQEQQPIAEQGVAA